MRFTKGPYALYKRVGGQAHVDCINRKCIRQSCPHIIQSYPHIRQSCPEQIRESCPGRRTWIASTESGRFGLT